IQDVGRGSEQGEVNALILHPTGEFLDFLVHVSAPFPRFSYSMYQKTGERTIPGGCGPAVGPEPGGVGLAGSDRALRVCIGRTGGEGDGKGPGWFPAKPGGLGRGNVRFGNRKGAEGVRLGGVESGRPVGADVLRRPRRPFGVLSGGMRDPEKMA